MTHISPCDYESLPRKQNRPFRRVPLAAPVPFCRTESPAMPVARGMSERGHVLLPLALLSLALFAISSTGVTRACAAAPTIDVSTPMLPPDWALLERRAIARDGGGLRRVLRPLL